MHEQHIDLPWGSEIPEFHLIEAPDWVAVLAITASDELVLVEQYRHGARKLSTELPAGVIEPSESPEAAARRELREETGYEAELFEPLIVLNTEPSRHTNRAHFFVARGARCAAPQHFDECENIAVVLLEQRRVMAAIEQGRILHGLHIGVLMLAAHKGILHLG